MRRIAEGLNRIGFGVEWVIASPLVRAAETAEIVASSLPFKVPLDTCAALSPGGSIKELAAFLSAHADRRRILLVGHEPDLSRLAGRIMGAGRDANITFKKGGCCLIQSDDLSLASAGRLIWWLTPRLLRVLARGA
jgi:phosphohistidine phosphatase